MADNNLNIEIIFEDEDIVVVTKPPGMLSIPDRYDPKLISADKVLRKKYGNIFVVHRLDKETSGVMVFAKNAGAHKHLNTQFQEQQVKKIYHAILSGILPKDEIEIDIPLMTHPGKKGEMIPSVRGKESLSVFRIIEKFRMATLVEVDLVTGRQHQLRAHASALGFPLLVDSIYGDQDAFYVSSVKKRFNLKKGTEEKPLIDRITMHSYELSFIHPGSGEKLSFKTEYPKDFSAALRILRKYAPPPSF